MVRVLTPQQFAADLRRQVLAFGPRKRKRFMRKIGGKVLHNMVLIRFLRGGFLKVGDWKSRAKERKFNNRWSKKYKKRPTGAAVTPDKIRMIDGGDLANSYRILHADSTSVTVGPGKRGHGGAAEKIAEKEEKGGNPIVGFSPEIDRALATEMQNYLNLVARGLEPPYLPKSRIGRRMVRV